MLDLLDPIFPRDEIITGVVGPVIGTHAGPRVIGASFQVVTPTEHAPRSAQGTTWKLTPMTRGPACVPITGVVGPVIGTHAGPRVIGVSFQVVPEHSGARAGGRYHLVEPLAVTSVWIADDPVLAACCREDPARGRRCRPSDPDALPERGDRGGVFEPPERRRRLRQPVTTTWYRLHRAYELIDVDGANSSESRGRCPRRGDPNRNPGGRRVAAHREGIVTAM